MTIRDVKNAQPGDLLRIKRGYNNAGMHAEFVEGSANEDRVFVLMPGRTEKESKPRRMFVLIKPTVGVMS